MPRVQIGIYSLFILQMITAPIHGQYLMKINDFRANEADLSLVGNAHVNETILRLTESKKDVQGACWYSRTKVDLSQGFETEFTFRISGNQGPQNGGDGFAFVIHNQSLSSIGGTGDKIGYKEIPWAVAIEFDTYNNDEGSKNHVCLSFYEGETKRYKRDATVHQIPELNDGQEHFARIEYKDGELRFFLDSYIFPVLTSKIDLIGLIQSSDGRAYVGFTAATSDLSSSNHDLLSWNFLESLPAPEEIDEQQVEIRETEELEVRSRVVKIRVWDHNKIDGDVISIKANDKWILTEQELDKKPIELEYTLTGFQTRFVLYAHNIGKIPPNTATMTIDDGTEKHTVVLESDLKSSEAIILRYGRR